MAWKERFAELDSRLLGVPKDTDEAFQQTTRYWWVGLAVSVALVLVVSLLAIWVSLSFLGAVILSPLLAFASGYYYSERMRAIGVRSRWLDLRDRD